MPGDADFVQRVLHLVEALKGLMIASIFFMASPFGVGSLRARVRRRCRIQLKSCVRWASQAGRNRRSLHRLPVNREVETLALDVGLDTQAIVRSTSLSRISEAIAS